jgi:hypothetical protein
MTPRGRWGVGGAVMRWAIQRGHAESTEVRGEDGAMTPRGRWGVGGRHAMGRFNAETRRARRCAEKTEAMSPRRLCVLRGSALNKQSL